MLERQSFDDERVEAVERADDARREPAAFRRLRIDVAELRKTGSERRIAMHGDRMRGLGAAHRPGGRAHPQRRADGRQHRSSFPTPPKITVLAAPGES